MTPHPSQGRPGAEPGVFTVLFVCTGNLYRSPIAERLLVARLAEREEGGARPETRIRVVSAGTRARPGAVLSGPTRDVIAELGGDPDGFVSRRLAEQHVARADLVLGLAREHREEAVRLHPPALRRCFTVEEFVRLAHVARASAVTADSLPGAGTGPDAVVAHAAALRGRVRPPAPDDDDIADPDGLPVEALRACGARVDRASRRVAASLTRCHELLANGLFETSG